jgi:carbon storage regulator
VPQARNSADPYCARKLRLLYCRLIVVQAGEAPDVLVLTRKGNQSIMIGDDIEVSVLAIMGEKVRIGIDAPRAVPVFRKEVYVEIQQDREGAAAEERYAS